MSWIQVLKYLKIYWLQVEDLGSPAPCKTAQRETSREREKVREWNLDILPRPVRKSPPSLPQPARAASPWGWKRANTSARERGEEVEESQDTDSDAQDCEQVEGQLNLKMDTRRHGDGTQWGEGGTRLQRSHTRARFKKVGGPVGEEGWEGGGKMGNDAEQWLEMEEWDVEDFDVQQLQHNFANAQIKLPG